MSEISMPVRFGLVGTGYWARELHAVGVAGHPDAELVGVWGRDPDKAAALAGTHGATGFSGSDGYDDMLAVVDAVVFSVPPDVQAALAVRAAQAGRHLLLEKPVALSHAAASEVADAVAGAGVASVVFFTERFVAEREAWLQERVAAETLGGEAAWLASLRTPDNPFAGSQWRQQRGGLWDVGPHALSVLLPVLGPVTSVAGARGREDLVHLVLTHQNGATSTVGLSLTMPPNATRAKLAFYDEKGWHTRPDTEQAGSGDAVSHQRRAVGELVENLRTGDTEHRVDVRFGAEVVRVLELAQQVVDACEQRHASPAVSPTS
jgi:predicted dehydrogenase